MFPLLGGLFAGGASLLGSMFSSNTANQNNQANIQMQQQTNQMSVEEAQKNRDFQQQMSSTAYQRSSADMQKAGLNPAMMFGSGSAASTPGGSMPSLQSPHSDMKSPLAGVGDAVGRALDATVTAKTVDRMSDEIANLKAQHAKIEAETKTEGERPALVRSESANVQQHTTAAKLDRARQEWEAIKYLDLSGIPDVARKAGNIGSWAGGKASDAIAPLLNGALSARRLFSDRFYY